MANRKIIRTYGKTDYIFLKTVEGNLLDNISPFVYCLGERPAMFLKRIKHPNIYYLELKHVIENVCCLNTNVNLN